MPGLRAGHFPERAFANAFFKRHTDHSNNGPAFADTFPNQHADIHAGCAGRAWHTTRPGDATAVSADSTANRHNRPTADSSDSGNALTAAAGHVYPDANAAAYGRADVGPAANSHFYSIADTDDRVPAHCDGDTNISADSHTDVDANRHGGPADANIDAYVAACHFYADTDGNGGADKHASANAHCHTAAANGDADAAPDSHGGPANSDTDAIADRNAAADCHANCDSGSFNIHTNTDHRAYGDGLGYADIGANSGERLTHGYPGNNSR